MAELNFDCLDVTPERYGIEPTLLFRLRVAEATATTVHAIALRCQIRIDPGRRDYSEKETRLLARLFGDRSRWGETLRPLPWTTVSVLVPSFTDSIDIEMPVTCTYDLQVTAGGYFHALSDGEVPLLMLFSGTVFGKGGQGFWIEQVPWRAETLYRMPVSAWQSLMNIHFPDSGWIRLRRDTIDELLRYQAAHSIPTWDDTVSALLPSTGEVSR